MRRRTRRAGFTLVELMVATVAGAIAVGGVYYLNGVSSRIFGEQSRVSETQMSLRGAMDQLRRDIARAGYLSTPDSNLLRGCEGTPGSVDVAPAGIRVRSMELTLNGSFAGNLGLTTMLAPAVNRVRADLLTLWGNYATADAYLGDVGSASGHHLVLQQSSESFRRSFFDPAAGVISAARFRETFRAGRMLRVENEGRVFLRVISDSGVDADGAWIDLKTALPSCFDRSRWTAVSPVMRIQYALERDDQDPLFRRLRPAEGTSALGSRRALLVRREVDTDDPSVTRNPRMVLDYAVEFAVVPIQLMPATTTFRYALSNFDAVTDDDVAEANANPASISSVLVTLSSRSAEADPRLPMLGRTPEQAGTDLVLSSPLLTVRVVDPAAPNVVMNARVRTMRSEILLQNQ